MKLIFLIFESTRPNWVAVCKTQIHSLVTHNLTLEYLLFTTSDRNHISSNLLNVVQKCMYSKHPQKRVVVVKNILILSGPCTKSKPQCLHCFNKLSTSTRVDCRSCGYPFCSIKCTKATEHRVECSIFR